MSYRPKHFGLQELVSPDIYKARGERAWELLDTEALITLDELREHFGAITVNDWHWAGQYRYSGLRPFRTRVGANYSQHKFGRAFDPKPHRVTVQEMYAQILQCPHRFPRLRVLENIDATPTWLHFDVRNHTRSGIWIVSA